MSEESVSSAGIISSSAGQLLKVSTQDTGAMACALTLAPTATDAAPRTSTIQAVRAGKRFPTRMPALLACWTTSSACTSGSEPMVTAVSSAEIRVSFWYGAQLSVGASCQASATVCDVGRYTLRRSGTSAP